MKQPWRQNKEVIEDANGTPLVILTGDEKDWNKTAALIVRAVNMHDDLLEAVKLMRDDLKDCRDRKRSMC